MNLNDSPAGMAEQTGDQFIYSEKSRDNPKIEMYEYGRVNIRPRKLSFFLFLNLNDKKTKNF